ncbi:matrixin family metalloprotease [Lactiplantibacillus plantarum]|uniref:matrixin family metalloprotease n=1 Tax=Lactiplantibacillus plantarum TaxID=1590 RepID=UPI0021CB4E85|nr:matrixin family metalloprotease [Lactiplantibacillus plantarum]
MRFPKRIFSTLATISLTTSFGLLSANASTKATTPMLGYRYDKQAANYQDLSSSDYYKDVWNNATASWKKAGFTWTKAATAKTTVSSYDGSSDMTLAGYNSVSYNKSTGEITSSKVRINRAVFEKYNYTKAERTNVAEHELGHALGIGHNNTDSVSVMNPANRYYTIQACDINGMKARYATTTTFDSVPNNPGEIITVTEYLHVQPKITNITTNYSSQSHSLILKGRAIGIEHLTLTYQGKKFEPSTSNQDNSSLHSSLRATEISN